MQKKILQTNKFFNIAVTLLLLVQVFSACRRDYLIGGVPQDVNQYKNISTYDFLKSNPLYDTLVLVIDAAGIKDKINEKGVTFYAPSDYSIFRYLNDRTVAVQQTNRNAVFGLDSLVYYLKNNINGTGDSMRLYLVHQSLPYTALTNTGALYPTELTGDTVAVSFELTQNGYLGYNSVVSNVPQVQYFTQLWHHYDLSAANPANTIPGSIGVRTLCISSFINTQTGIVNALDNSHELFFYGTRQ